MQMKRMMLALGLALGLGLGMNAATSTNAQADTYMSFGISVGTPASYYYGGPRHYDDYYVPPHVRPRHVYAPPRRYRPRVVRVYRQVCSRRIKVIRTWSYRKQRWVKKRIAGPRRCWRERIR